ncbi:heme peroxidase [Chytriomyces sp. MP71]|nr:heme peroxidase [Chytriomyces sp. MP71]
MQAPRNLLEPVKERHPHISYADIWTLAAVSAIEAAGGPCIEWRPGRLDHLSILETAPRVRIQARNGNSPPLRRASTSASLANASNLRQLNQLGASSLGESDLRASCIQFGLDWTDRNLVALAGYPLYPGNELFGNQFFKDLVDLRINNADLDLDVDATEESWLLRALTRDEEFWNIVREYAADELAFREGYFSGPFNMLSVTSCVHRFCDRIQQTDSSQCPTFH